MPFKNARCNICNKVSHGEISSDYGDHFYGSFISDPVGFGYICWECADAIEDVRTSYHIEDELKDEQVE